MTATEKAQLEMVRMQTRAKFPYLIKITTPDNQIFRYANSVNNIEFEYETYEASYFKLEPPEQTENGIKDARITISSIDQVWIEKIRKYQDRSLIRFVAVIQRDEQEISGITHKVIEYVEKLDDITFKLTNATWNETTIQWTMKFDDFMEIKMPCQKLTQFIAPALY